MTPTSPEPLHPAARELPPREGGLASYPPVDRWGDWEEYDPVAWPRKVTNRIGRSAFACALRSISTKSSRET